jgi:hypothetical protein
MKGSYQLTAIGYQLPLTARCHPRLALLARDDAAFTQRPARPTSHQLYSLS